MNRNNPPDHLALLDQRLGAAARALLDGADTDVVADPASAGLTSARILPELVAVATDPSRSDARWLLLTAVHGAFPTSAHLQEFGRELELAPPAVMESRILAQVLTEPRRGRLDLPMDVVTDAVVVDVDFSARHDTHTGIHRVVRETVPRWHDENGALPVAWIDEYTAFRRLAPREAARVLAHGREVDIDLAEEAAYRPRLVVPWRSVVILPDIPAQNAGPVLVALATSSGNEVGMIGYDFIPVTSAETRPPGDATTFAAYLTVVKHARRVAGISASSAAEFAGFVRSLGAQGLPGPEVREVPLATEPPRAEPSGPGHGERPVVLCVGSREPHKNQRAALHAAERLWRDGLDFEVRLVGGPGWSDTVLRSAITRLEAGGRPITALGRVSDDRLRHEIESADIVYFASLHEGYGLPVTEALACGTPVITSDFGSQAEIAALGGCLTVDPRDDGAITAAMRRLLTDPEERARLRTEAHDRPVRTWDTYAADLWAYLIEETAP